MGPGAQGLLVLASAVVVGAGIKAARPILTPTLLAALIALATAPLLARLRKRGVPVGFAIMLVLLLTLSCMLLLGGLIGGSINAFLERIPQYEAELRAAANLFADWLGRQGIALSPETLGKAIDPGPVLTLVGHTLQGAASFVSMVVLVLLVVAFMLAEAIGVRGKLDRIGLSPTQVEELKGATSMVHRYLGVKTFTSALTGLLVGLWTATMGIELAAMWGLLAFLLNYIPTIGSIIAAIPAVTLATLQQGPATGLIVAAGYLAANLAVGNGLEPRMLGDALGLSPLVVVFSLLLWGYLLGPVGALLCVPLTVVVRIYLASMPDLAWLAILLGPPLRPDSLGGPRSVPPPEDSDDAAS